MKIEISFNDLVDYIFTALTELGYVPTEEETEIIASILLDYLLFEVLGLDVKELD